MDDLTRWLDTQLDEDTRRLTDPHSDHSWHTRGCESLPDVLYPDREPGACDCGVPERMRREIEAKRGIVRAYETVVAAFNDSGPAMANYDRLTGSVSSLRGSLKLLTTVYENRPGYKGEWRP